VHILIIKRHDVIKRRFDVVLFYDVYCAYS